MRPDSGPAMSSGRTVKPHQTGGADESACTPGSVTGAPCGTAPAGDHPSRPAVAGRLVRSTRRLGRAALERLRGPDARRRRTLLDLAPGGVCRAARVTPGAGGLLHHRFTLTRHLAVLGGLLSVALSRGSPRVAVSNHPALWSPDVPRRFPCGNRRDRPADSSAVRAILRSLPRPSEDPCAERWLPGPQVGNVVHPPYEGRTVGIPVDFRDTGKVEVHPEYRLRRSVEGQPQQRLDRRHV